MFWLYDEVLTSLLWNELNSEKLKQKYGMNVSEKEAYYMNP
jgi:hypothetical protein